jgi:hypothetical protein
MADYEFDIEMDGVELTISFSLSRYNNKDVGLGAFGDVEDMDIIAVDGNTDPVLCSKTFAKLTSSEVDYLTDKCYEHAED